MRKVLKTRRLVDLHQPGGSASLQSTTLKQEPSKLKLSPDQGKTTKEGSFPAATIQTQKNESRMLVKAPGKLNELMMPDRASLVGKSYSNLIGKRAEQRRAQQQEESSKVIPVPYRYEDDFNAEILKSKFAAEVPGTGRRTIDPALRPTRSEATIKPLAKYLMEDNPILGGKPKMHIVRPRDRQIRAKPRLDPLAVNIFESMQ